MTNKPVWDDGRWLWPVPMPPEYEEPAGEGVVYTGAMGMHTFNSESEARLAWALLQICLTGTTNQRKWREFPPDAVERKEQRERDFKERETVRQKSIASKSVVENYSGEVLG